MSQRRMDLDERPELRFGSVDFLVGKEYWVQENQATPGSKPREPVPLNYVFAIDVSWTSARCGLVGEVVKGLRELLYPTNEEGEEPKPCGLPLGSKIGIVTFDRTVQYFNLKVSHSGFTPRSMQYFCKAHTRSPSVDTRSSPNACRARYRRHVPARMRWVPRGPR